MDGVHFTLSDLEEMRRFTAIILMMQHNYPDTRTHMSLHAKLITQVAELSAAHDAGKAMLTMEVMDFLENWLKDHILGEDKKLAAWLNK